MTAKRRKWRPKNPTPTLTAQAPQPPASAQRAETRRVPLKRSTAEDLLRRLGLEAGTTPGTTAVLVAPPADAAIPVGPVAPISVPDRWNAAVGCKTSEVALAIISQVVQLEHPPPNGSDVHLHTLLMDATVMLAELQPTTATEALLAAQMIGAQRVAMVFLRASTLDGQTIQGADANILRATRLMRLFNEQVDTMARLKGKGGQQRRRRARHGRGPAGKRSWGP